MMKQSMKKQQGAALGVGLILLVILTLMGYTGMKGTMLQEKMAAGLHNRTLALGGANTALREGESFFYDLVKYTNGVNVTGTPAGDFHGIYSYLEELIADGAPINPVITEFKERNWNSSSGTLSSHDFTAVHVNAKLKNNPQYLLYEIAAASGSGANSQEFGSGSTAAGDGAVQRTFGLIGKADSGDGKTFSLVGSTYTAVVSSDATN